MKAHRMVWRKKWMWALMVAALPLPAMAVLATRQLPMSLDRLVGVMIAGTGELLESTYGESVYTEYVELFPTTSLWGDSRTALGMRAALPMAPPLASAPSAAPEAEWLEDSYAELYARLDAIPAGRKAWFWPAAGEMGGRALDGPNFMSVMTATRVRSAIAVRAAGAGDWTRAVKEASAASRQGDPAEGLSLVGGLIAVASRNIGLSAFERMLDLDPPTEVSREAARRMGELADASPRMTDATLAVESGTMVRHMTGIDGGPAAVGPAILAPVYTNTMLLASAVSGVASKADSVSDPNDRQWLRQFWQTGMGYAGSPQSVTGVSIPWTRFAATRDRLVSIVERQPELLAGLVPSTPAYDALPLKERLFLQFHSGASMLEMQTRAEVVATRARLLQAAFAARVYRDERGEWPTSFEALDPALFPAAAAANGALHLGMAEVLDRRGPMQQGLADVAIGLIDDALSTTLSARGGGELAVTASGAEWFEFVVQRRPGNQPPVAMRMGYLREALLRSPGEGVFRTFEFLDAEDNPVDDGKLRDIGRAQLRAGLKQASLPVPAFLDDTVAEAPEYHGVATVRATIRMPRRVFAVWAPGPDGDNDGGRLVYSPGNGTLSNGDIVVLPGGF